MKRSLLAAYLSVALVACSGGGTSTTGTTASSSATAAPTIVDFPDPDRSAAIGPGPAPTSESQAMRERVVLGLLEGGGPIDEMPVEATDDGAPLDPGLRNRLAPAGLSTSVRVASITASAGLPVEVIGRIVRQSVGRVRQCHERGLLKNPNLIGRVDVTFSIGKTGSVYEARASGDLPDPAVVQCVQTVVASLTFPQPEAGAPVRVSAGFALTPPH